MREHGFEPSMITFTLLFKVGPPVPGSHQQLIAQYQNSLSECPNRQLKAILQLLTVEAHHACVSHTRD